MVESNSNIMLNLWKEGKTHVWKKKWSGGRMVMRRKENDDG